MRPAARASASACATSSRSGCGGMLPVVQRDAVGHDVQLAQVQPARGHVVVHLGQHRHHHVGVAVGGVLGRLHQQDEGMPARHARQLDRRQRPQVVHLVDQLRAAAPRQPARHPDVHRVGAGGDDHVGPELAPAGAACPPTRCAGRPRCCARGPGRCPGTAAWPPSGSGCRRSARRRHAAGARARAKSRPRRSAPDGPTRTHSRAR